MRSPPSLPATVVRALAGVRRRRRTLALVEAACWVAFGVAVVGLLVPAVGLAESGPGAWVRVVARFALLASVIVPVVLLVVPPWRRTADPLRVARAVDDRVPETRDSLLAAVDLAGALDAGRFDDPVTRHLARDHLAEASARVSVVDPRALLPWSGLGRRTLVGPGLALAAVLVTLLAPDQAERGWSRLFGPVAAAPVDAEGDDADEEEPVTLVLRNLVITLEPPAYAARETLTLDGTTGDFQALPGTRVTLVAQVPSGGETATVMWFPREGEPASLQGAVRGDRTEITFVAPGAGRYRVELGRGRLREPLRTRRFRVEALPDDPPDLEVSGPGGAVEIKADDVRSLVVLAGDDFALSRLELVVTKGRKELSRESIADVAGLPRFDGVHRWSPATLGGDGGELELVVEAWDNDTVNGPKVTRSRAIEAWVPTPRDHHRKVLALKRELLNRSLDLLGAVLVDNATLEPEASPDDVVVQHENEARLARGVFTTAAELAVAMEADKFEQRKVFLGIGTAIENLARRWEEVSELVETRIRPDKHSAVDRGTLALLATRREATIGELERIVLDLSAFIDVQIGEEASQRLAGVEPKLADLADLIRQSQEGGLVDEEIAAALAELQAALAEIAEVMAERGRGPDDSSQNRMPDGLQQSMLEQIRELLAQGKHEEAMEKLRQAMDALEQMRSKLGSEPQERAGGQKSAELAEQLQAGIEEAERLEAEQQAILDETKEIQERFGTGDSMDDDAERQMAEDIRELQERVAALPPEGLSPRTRGQVQAWVRPAARSGGRLAERFGEGDLQSAAQQAAEVESYLQEAGADLQSAAGDSAAAVESARGEVAGAAALAADIGRRLAEAEARSRRAQGQASAASEGAGERQGRTAQAVGQLRQQMEQMGGSAYNPVSGRDNLDSAKQMMERSQLRLGEGRTVPAVGSQEGALQQLRAFRESLQEAQQSMGEGGPMGEGQGQQMAGQGPPGPWSRAGDHDGTGDDQNDVEIPDPDDFVSPEAFRALVQEEAGGDAPERYRPLNGSYYEELIK